MTQPTQAYKSQLPVLFNQLNRDLLVADRPETWQPAVSAMSVFLDGIKELLVQEPELVGNNLVLSSRIFSLLLTVAATGTQGRLELYKGKDEKSLAYQRQIEEEYIPLSGDLRRKAIELAKLYLQNTTFESLREAISWEIKPLLDSMNDQNDPDR